MIFNIHITRLARRAAAMSAHRETLRAENIVKRFGAVTALDGVSLTLRQGEILGILGDNGAGKSTLMKILTGYQPPTSGTLFVRRAGGGAAFGGSCALARHRVRLSGSGAGEFAQRLSQHVPEPGDRVSAARSGC